MPSFPNADSDPAMEPLTPALVLGGLPTSPAVSPLAQLRSTRRRSSGRLMPRSLKSSFVGGLRERWRHGPVVLAGRIDEPPVLIPQPGGLRL